MTENTAKPDLEVLAEKVRTRLVQNGQHGALAEFGAYTAAVADECKAYHDTGFRRGLREGKPGEPAGEASPVEKAFISTPPASTSTKPVKAAAKPRAKKAAAK